MNIEVQKLMIESRVQFGTSGARGLAVQMTDFVCYVYTTAFINHAREKGLLDGGSKKVAVAGDLRDSTPRIVRAVSQAVSDSGLEVEYLGSIPTPALALFSLKNQLLGIMVTGSHIPADRNGIKFYLPSGEILKDDEQAIREQNVSVPEGMFNDDGYFLNDPFLLPVINPDGQNLYVDRFLSVYPAGSLAGMNVLIYEHSAVGRDLIVKIVKGLGANVLSVDRFADFVPVDTEAVSDSLNLAGPKWIKEFNVDAIISTDGDGDRPLISDEHGRWLKGDRLGLLTAKILEADFVATPINTSTALEKSGYFSRITRTKIGSPYVIEALKQGLAEGYKNVVGYEGNGGFLVGSDISVEGKILTALPTRDGLLASLSVLVLCRKSGQKISALVGSLPSVYTASGRIENVPSEKSRSVLGKLFDVASESSSKVNAEKYFGELCGRVASIDLTDGIRIIFENNEIIHLRVSGNAPEFRCYNEAGSEKRAMELNQKCLAIISGILT